jgi:hypothetical protein
MRLGLGIALTIRTFLSGEKSVLILRSDPAQKRIQAPDLSWGKIKILDPSSSSQIYLWGKSKI